MDFSILKKRSFVYDPYDLPELNVIQNDDGRFYVSPNGIMLPSVTSWISRNTDKSGIEKWRKWIGEEKADAIKERAADRGSEVHEHLEKYILGQEIKGGPFFQMFCRYKPHLNKNLGKIYAIEKCLWSETLNMGGRVDCIGDWKDTLSIIDFKTADKPKKEKYIQGYYIQTTLYALMTYERIGILPKKLVILIGNEKEKGCQTFEKDTIEYIPKVESIMGHKSKYSIDGGL